MSTAVAIEDLEALRTPLTGYCYRLLGSAADTDDAVQETLIRATTKSHQYDAERGQLSTWVHRIATNVCLDMLRAANRRALLVDPLPGHTWGSDIGMPLPAEQWVEPMPSSRLLGQRDPSEIVATRESVRLAFIAALQQLPPRQRAVLVLREVLAFTASETAEILDVTVSAVTSALQRARATMDANRPDPFDLADPTDPDQQDLLRRYVTAFEAHDIDGLTAILRDDAIASMPPFAWRVDGAERIAALIGASDACDGDRLIPCLINGGHGFGQYRLDSQGVPRPFALIAVDLQVGRVARLTTFLGTQDRFAEFGLPPSLPTTD